MIPEFLALAAMVWGPTPCGDQPPVVLEPMADQALGWTYMKDDFAPLGPIPLNQCVIHVNATLARGPYADPYTECSVIVHEFGHLAGQKHSPNPRSVMYPTVIHPYWRCVRLVDSISSFPPTRAHASSSSMYCTTMAERNNGAPSRDP